MADKSSTSQAKDSQRRRRPLPKAGQRAPVKQVASTSSTDGGFSPSFPPSSTAESSNTPNPPSSNSDSQSLAASDISGQPPVVNRPASKKRTNLKDKGSLSVVDIYPDRFLPPTRANIASLSNLGDNIAYPWKLRAGEGYYYTGPEMIDIKTRCDYELRRHFLVFSSSKAIGWIIRSQCPEMDISSQQSKALREYLLGLFRSFKHEFLFERFYSHVHNLIKDYPDEMDRRETDPASFRKWLRGRLDSNVFRYIYGPRTAAVIDYNKTFADKKQLPFWYFQQIFCAFAAKLCEIVKAEMALNEGIVWSIRLPKDAQWRTDLNQRHLIRDMFDAICTIEKFRHVELDCFTWVPLQSDAERAPDRRVAERTQRASQVIQENFQFDDSPPPSESTMPSFTSGSFDQSDRIGASFNEVNPTDPEQPGPSENQESEYPELDGDEPDEDGPGGSGPYGDSDQDEPELVDPIPIHLSTPGSSAPRRRNRVERASPSPLGRELPGLSSQRRTDRPRRVINQRTSDTQRHLIDPRLRQTPSRQRSGVTRVHDAGNSQGSLQESPGQESNTQVSSITRGRSDVTDCPDTNLINISEEEDSDLTERSPSPTVQYLQRASLYRAGYH
ncbi:hypothetical protein AAE478_004546 [Parahypoxylon ruwenzoriense]